MDINNQTNGPFSTMDVNRIMSYAKAFAAIHEHKTLVKNVCSTSNYHVAMGYINDYQKNSKGVTIMSISLSELLIPTQVFNTLSEIGHSLPKDKRITLDESKKLTKVFEAMNEYNSSIRRAMLVDMTDYVAFKHTKEVLMNGSSTNGEK